MQARRTRSRARIALVTGAALLASTALAACGSESSSSGSDEIVIGAYGPLSGPAASLDVLYKSMDAYFDDLNESGGINGLKVKFVVQDDQLNPAQTPAAARKLVERDKASMICGPAGSPTTMAVKSYLEAKSIGIVPGAGSSELIGPTSYLQVPTYSPLAAQLVQYAVEDLKKKRIAIAYTDDAVGKPTLAGATWQLKQLGVKPVATVAFNGTAPDQSALAAKLKAADADFVVINNTAPVISQVFKAAEKIGYEPQWGATWPALNQNLLKLSGDSLATGNIVFSSPFVLGDAPEAKTFRDALAEHDASVDTTDTIAMLGWTSATVCAEVVKRAVEDNGGKVPSAKQIVDAMPGTTVDDDYVSGLSWTKDDHTGQKKSTIIGVKGGKFVALTENRDLPDAPESE